MATNAAMTRKPDERLVAYDTSYTGASKFRPSRAAKSLRNPSCAHTPAVNTLSMDDPVKAGSDVPRAIGRRAHRLRADELAISEVVREEASR